MVFNKIIKVQQTDRPVIVGQQILVELPDTVEDVKYFRCRVLVAHEGPAEYRVILN